MNEESVSGARSGRLVYKFDEKPTEVFEDVSQSLTEEVNPKVQNILGSYTYVTKFAKTGPITGERNCTYSPFSSANSIFVDFQFS